MNDNRPVIRLEAPGDYRAVENLTREAFWNQSVPGCDEHYLVHTMRRHPDFWADQCGSGAAAKGLWEDADRAFLRGGHGNGL